MSRQEAERAAGRLEEQLKAGNLPGSGEGVAISWKDFRERYENEWLEQLSFGSRRGWATAVAHFERICKPRYLSEITKSMLSEYRAELEALDISPASVRSYFRAIRAGLGWAESVDLLERVPTIRQRRQVKQQSSMRSRPITYEEFERMLSKVPDVRPKDAKEFDRFMRGLWWSGLRISELNNLHWDRGAPVHVDQSGSVPLIVFLGGQKSKADSYLPAPPEFWKIANARGHARNGHVFKIPGRYDGTQMDTFAIGRRISDIGKAAGVIVDPSTGKCATAHDLRRAYLTNVAQRATMSQTQALARHADPKTTSQYYVKHEAQQLAEAMGWLVNRKP